MGVVDLTNVAYGVLDCIVLGLHDVRDRGVQAVLILHLTLQLQVLQVETHLGFLHLFGRLN